MVVNLSAILAFCTMFVYSSYEENIFKLWAVWIIAFILGIAIVSNNISLGRLAKIKDPLLSIEAAITTKAASVPSETEI